MFNVSGWLLYSVEAQNRSPGYWWTTDANREKYFKQHKASWIINQLIYLQRTAKLTSTNVAALTIPIKKYINQGVGY